MEIIEIEYKAPIKKFKGKFQESSDYIQHRPYTRKLKAVWTHEAAQDFRSQHNIDALAELMKLLR